MSPDRVWQVGKENAQIKNKKTKRQEKLMKKFFGEFKTFITRGNVLDMAVGVIVGGAFTGIVNGLSNYILKPIINWLLALVLGTNGLEGAVTFLSKSYTKDAAGAEIIDMANSIYIDWGAFISAIINFFLIAIVLFLIVRIFNKLRDGNGKFTESIKKNTFNRAERKELKKAGIKWTDRKQALAYFESKEEAEKLKAEEEAKAAEEQARLDRLANPTTEDLLKDIKALLEKQVADK